MSKSDSIILTIHNKENLIQQVLNGIFKNTTTNSELILVFDGCTDNSEEIALEFCKNYIPNNLKLKYTITDNVFETKANNAGAKLATGDYVIFTQDDCVIIESRWNERLKFPFLNFNDIFAISGNCTHNWKSNPNSKHLHMNNLPDNCWSDILIHYDHKNNSNTDRETFAIRDSSNRGPLMMRHDIFEKNMGFDENNIYRQDLDDAEICTDVYKKFGLLSGFYSIKFKSDLAWGGTRENGITKQWLLYANQLNSKMFYNKHKDIIDGKKHNEERILIFNQ